MSFRGAIILLVLGGIVASFGTGFMVGVNQVPAPIEGVTNLEQGKPDAVDFSLFWDAWRKVQEKYVRSGDLDYQVMVHGAIRGMVNSLEDPYTVFMDPGQTERFLEDIGGSFGGVGMEIGIRKGELQVISPLDGTPADRAGLRPGDRILKVGETFTRDLTIDEAVSLIRGQPGTEVTLTIFRDEWEEAEEIKITRAVIEIPSLSWEMKEDKIAYLRIHHFSETARLEFQQAAQEILQQDAQGIVLDLRNNPGGFLEVSQAIAGWFLERGQVVTIEDFGGKQEERVYKAKGPGNLRFIPVVVLINEGSASASEILAGALRDNRGALLLGKQSFGKGSVQELEDLNDDSSLKITVASWLTPSGTLIEGEGLTPDIEIETTEADFEADRDPVLDRALEELKKL